MRPTARDIQANLDRISLEALRTGAQRFNTPQGRAKLLEHLIGTRAIDDKDAQNYAAVTCAVVNLIRSGRLTVHATEVSLV